ALFARRSALARRFLYSTLGACLAYLCVCCFHGPGRCLHVRSSPTRRSSDLELKAHYTRGGLGDVKVKRFLNEVIQEELEPIRKRDRKSTRLNSSHVSISYAVFCLKKKEVTTGDGSGAMSTLSTHLPRRTFHS